MSRFRVLLVVLPFIVFLSPLLPAQEEQVPECFRNLPPGISIKRSFYAPPEKFEAIGKKFGVEIERVSNTILRAYGGEIQINIVKTSSSADAEKFYQLLLKVHRGDTTRCLRKGLLVYEFHKAGGLLVKKVASELGIIESDIDLSGGMCYRVTADIALVEKPDYMTANELTNIFFNVDKAENREEVKGRIREMAESYQFGNSLMLRNPRLGGIKYSFEPEPVKEEELNGGTVKYYFRDEKKRFGVPYVTVSMEIPANDSLLLPTGRKPDPSLVCATDHWPADNPEIGDLAREITAGTQTVEERVEAILKWLEPGRNIELGEKKGTRWGVDNVLENRRGRCCDFSDLFITLCRSLDIPSRLVGGWVYQTAGHAWVEVLIEGEGWRQVDPTTGRISDFGAFYIPYFTSETGDMPFLYISKPAVEVLK